LNIMSPELSRNYHNDLSKWAGALKNILDNSGGFRDVKIILGGHGVTARVRISD
jgi:hypothetical protein